MIKGLILLKGFPNNKYPPNTKNYLRVFINRGGWRLVLGGRDYMIVCPESEMTHFTHSNDK